MPWPSCSRSRTQIRFSHLCESEPGQPGMTSRSGPPWMFGSGWPFMAKTIRLCSSIALGIGMPRESASLLASPDRCGSAP